MHIDMGRMVEEVFRQFKAKNRGCNVTWFASRLNCDRRNVYDIFRRPTIDTQLLSQISLILGHNFFRDISDILENRISNFKPDPKSGLSFYLYLSAISVDLKGTAITIEFYDGPDLYDSLEF